MDVVEAPPSTAKAELCKECHVNEYKEWKKSRHSKSYTSDYFRRQTDNYQVEKCLTCHSANPMYKAEKLTVRTENVKEGVTCVTCHLTPDNNIGGPLFVLPAHFSDMMDPYYRDVELCGTCHKEHLDEYKTVKKSLSAPKQKELDTCQNCHMPMEHRKLIVEGVMQYAHWAQDTKKHTFEHAVPPKLEQEWINIKPTFKNTKKGFAISVVMNHKIPHSLPSGLFGFKAIDLVISLKDHSGKTVDEQIQTFYVEEDRNLVYGKDFKKTYTFPTNKEAEYVEFKVNRRKNRVDFGRVIFKQRHRIQYAP